MSNLSIGELGLALWRNWPEHLLQMPVPKVRPIGTRFGSAFCCFRGSLFSQSRLVIGYYSALGRFVLVYRPHVLVCIHYHAWRGS